MEKLKNPYVQILIILLVGVIYIGAARLGLLLALPPGYASPFWPPSGIATAAVLMIGNWVWPGIFLGSFIANLLTTAGDLSVNMFVSSGIAIGSTLQALAVGYLVKRFADGVDYFRTHKTVFNFIISTFIGCLIAASIGLLYLSIANVINIRAIGTNWVTWWLGDSVGIFIYTSFIITLFKTFDPEEFFHQFLEAMQIITFITLIAVMCFWDWIGQGYPIEYMFIPFLIWAIFRFEPYFCLGLLILVSSIAVAGTAKGFGPFAYGSTNESLLLLQAFIGCFAMGALFMMSILTELNTAFDKLEEYNKLLQEQVLTTDQPKELPDTGEKSISNLKSHTISNAAIKGQNKRTFVDFNGLVIGFTNLAYLNRQSTESNFKLNLQKELDPKIGLVEISPVDFSRALILLLDNAFDSVLRTEQEVGNDFLAQVSVNTRDFENKVSIIIRNNGTVQDSQDNKSRLTECYDIIVGKLKGELKFQQEDQFSEYQIIFPKVHAV